MKHAPDNEATIFIEDINVILDERGIAFYTLMRWCPVEFSVHISGDAISLLARPQDHLALQEFLDQKIISSKKSRSQEE